LNSGIIKNRVGVWLDIGTSKERKIAAIGIKSSRYVTMHGLALNINTDLSMFQHIVPCGIPDKGVTSLKMELNEEIPLFEVNELLVNEICRNFALKIT
jgi:lipoyl(octanoyl) transferase